MKDDSVWPKRQSNHPGPVTHMQYILGALHRGQHICIFNLHIYMTWHFDIFFVYPLMIVLNLRHCHACNHRVVEQCSMSAQEFNQMLPRRACHWVSIPLAISLFLNAYFLSEKITFASLPASSEFSLHQFTNTTSTRLIPPTHDNNSLTTFVCGTEVSS
jgi:hypothetical protein